VEPVVLAPLDVSGPLHLRRISEEGQTGKVGSQIPLEVVVTDAQGNPVADLPVTFTVLSGPGMIPPACVPTDTTGQASTILTITEAGAIRVEASVAGEALILSAAGKRDEEPGEGQARLSIVSGNNQGGAPGAVLPEPLVVRLEDQFGNPLPEVPVTAKVIQGKAYILSEPQVPTDAQGEARFTLRVGESEETIVTQVSALDQEVEFQSLIVALAFPSAIAIEASGSLVVADWSFGAVVRVDSGTGDITLVSGLGRGTGPSMDSPEGITVAPDGSLVVVGGKFESGLGAVVRVAPDTGNRTVLSGCAASDPETGSCTALIGTGPPLVSPIGIAVESDGALVVTDWSLGAVMRVDPDTGDRTAFSGCTAFDPETGSCTAPIGTGPPLESPVDIAVAPDGSLAVVGESDFGLGLGVVVWVDPDTGDRTALSGCIAFDSETSSCTALIGTGPPLYSPAGIAVAPDGSLVVSAFRAVMRVAPHTGDRTVLSGCAALDVEIYPDGWSSSCTASIGTGPSLEFSRDIAVAPNGFLVVVGGRSDSDAEVVVRIAPDTGDRTVLSEE
jgi:sugar lactone lactonase YvrE